ncbi:hypothetical protein [Patulibacter defluvii]|uniref:hypothetical protein n=1 Tax=Patulibacter defluvii TaxID=3095358 RepID=UPI002A757CBE|nr:hypothetical protein [Patulibacter sp. DM4]
MKKSKGFLALALAAGALSVATAQASAASTYSVSPASTTLYGTLTGGPVVIIHGNITVKCTSSMMAIAGMSTTSASLPATFSAPAPWFGGCTGVVAGLPRPTTVSTAGSWSATLGTTNYQGTINPINSGATITVGTCVITVNASTVAIEGRDAANVVPALGSPASYLTLNGSANVSTAGPCPTSTTASIVADGSSVAGSTTGRYQLTGAITEN